MVIEIYIYILYNITLQSYSWTDPTYG